MTLQVLCKRGFCNSHISLGFQNRGCFLLISSAAQQLCYPRLCVLHVWKYTQRMAGSSCGTIVPTLVWPESRFTDWKFRFLQRVLHLVVSLSISFSMWRMGRVQDLIQWYVHCWQGVWRMGAIWIIYSATRAHLGWSQELRHQLAAVRSYSAGVSDSRLVLVAGENLAVSKSRRHCFGLFDDEVNAPHPRRPSL